MLSVAECGFCLVGCVCEREREGERQASVSLEESQSGRRSSPSIAENTNVGWHVCGRLVEEPVCLWPLSGRMHENRVPFAS